MKNDRYTERQRKLITNPIIGFSFNVNKYINFVSAEEKKQKKRFFSHGVKALIQFLVHKDNSTEQHKK